MLRQKERREQDLRKGLEADALILQAGSGMIPEDNAVKNRCQKCHVPQKRKFFCKKRKKARHFQREIFCDCFYAAIDVLYYGCLCKV